MNATDKNKWFQNIIAKFYSKYGQNDLSFYELKQLIKKLLYI